jgi:preprotein translocase subunit SecG
MGLFGIILLVLFAIVCALLIFMVVIQDQDSEGLGGLFGGAGNAAFGSRSTNVVVKFTYVLGGLFFVIAFSLAVLNRGSMGDVEAAARISGEETTEWWSENAQPVEALPGTEPELTVPQDAPIPQEATAPSGDGQ